MAATRPPVSLPASAHPRERNAAIAAADGLGSALLDARAASSVRNLPSKGPAIRISAPAARDSGMPATILGMPVERCTANSSASGAAANLTLGTLAPGASQTGEGQRTFEIGRAHV